MTVASVQNRKTFAGDDATTSFATTPIVFFATSDLQVYVTTDATGASELLTEGTHYTVSGGDESVGATGTVDTSGGSSPHGALLAGTTLVILRELPLTQGADFVNNDASDAGVAEAALDKLVMTGQRFDEKLERSMKLPDSDVTGESMELPVLADRASKTLGFDAGGGLAMYDPASAVTASENVTFVPSGIGAISTTVQDKNRRLLDVFDFIPTSLHSGIQARTNSTDLSTYIQTAINEAISSKRRLDLGPYELDIENTLEVQLTSNIEIFGHGYSGGTSGACKFIWNGANDGTVLLIDRVRDSEFYGFAIQAGTGTIGVGVDIDGIGTLTVVPSNCIFRKIQVNTSTTAIRIANTSSSNNEFHRFYDVMIVGTGTNGYEILDGQSKQHKIYNGSVGGRTYGIKVTAGSFTAYSPNFDDNGTDIFVDQPSDAILVAYPTSENSERFFDDSGAAGSAFSFTVLGGRVVGNGLHADGDFIRYHRTGPLNMIGVDWAAGTAVANWTIEATSANAGTIVNAVGCIFPNATPFNRTPLSDRHTINQMGCLYVDSGTGRPLPMPSQTVNTVIDAANVTTGPKVELFDDFMGDTIDGDKWATAVGSDPQCVAAAIRADQLGGLIRMTTGDDAGDTMALNGTQLHSGLHWRADRQQLAFEIRIAMTAITSVAVFFGFTDQNAALEMPFTLGASDVLTSNATNAVGVLFDTAADTDQWALVGVKADADATVQFAGVAPSANVMEVWRIEIITGSGVFFYRNGTLIGSKMSNAITEGTSVTPVVAAFSRAAATRSIDVDFIKVSACR